MGITPDLCRVCGADCPKTHGGSPRKFCSRQCYWKSKKGQPLALTSDVALKAQKKATRKAARATRGTDQSPEHRARRFAAMWKTLAATPKACSQCGEGFIRTTPAQRFCTSRCWLAGHRKRYVREKRFTIPADEYKRLLALQENRCAICGWLSGSNDRNDRLAVDHCHDRMVVRGLLCHRCNTALGLLRDDVAVMERAIAYLRGS